MSKSSVTDFNRWIEQTSHLLQTGQWDKIDVPELVEEIEDLGKRERRAIASQLIRLLLHLLKWQYQPRRRSDSWLDSITDARTQIQLAIEDSPSLKSYPAETLHDCYQRARRQAAKQTGLAIATFPESCPYQIESILSDEWSPGASPSAAT